MSTSDTDKTLEMPPRAPAPAATRMRARMLSAEEIADADIVEEMVMTPRVAPRPGVVAVPRVVPMPRILPMPRVAMPRVTMPQQATPNTTQEIIADDVLEVMEVAQSIDVAFDPEMSVPTQRRPEPIAEERRVSIASVAPMAVDITLPPMKPDWSMEIVSEAIMIPRRRLGGAVAAVMVVAGAILGAGLVRMAWPSDANATASATTTTSTAIATSTSIATAPATTTTTGTPAPRANTTPTAKPFAPPTPKPATTTTATNTATPTPKNEVPLVDVTALPRAPLGTIIAPAKTQLFVDNAFVASPAVVKCGKHKVRLGWTGRSKTVDVPCSGEVSVQ